MNPTTDPLYHHILGGLLASGMHPSNAIERAEEMYHDIRRLHPPEPHLYRLAFLFLLVLIAILVCTIA